MQQVFLHSPVTCLHQTISAKSQNKGKKRANMEQNEGKYIKSALDV